MFMFHLSGWCLLTIRVMTWEGTTWEGMTWEALGHWCTQGGLWEQETQPSWGSTKMGRGSSQTLPPDRPEAASGVGYRACAQQGRSASMLLRFPWSGPERKEAPSSLQGISPTETGELPEAATEPAITPHLSSKLAGCYRKRTRRRGNGAPPLPAGLSWKGRS